MASRVLALYAGPVGVGTGAEHSDRFSAHRVKNGVGTRKATSTITLHSNPQVFGTSTVSASLTCNSRHALSPSKVVIQRSYFLQNIYTGRLAYCEQKRGYITPKCNMMVFVR